jgi:hypothetical protein
MQLQIGSIDDLVCQRTAARNVDGLSAVVGFAASGVAGAAGLSATEVLGAGQFVARVVNDFVRAQLRRGVGAKTSDFSRENAHQDQQKGLQHECRSHAAVGKSSVRGFAGEARAGAGEGGFDRGDKLFPSRRPLDEELGRIVKLDDADFVELESVTHRATDLS